MNEKGVLLVVSGPSGVGKATLIKDALQHIPWLTLSISATTRKPRPGEVNGVHYHFLTKEQFLKLVESDGLLEYAEYAGNYYGTLKTAVQQELLHGKSVLLEIEVQGAEQIILNEKGVESIFILPPGPTMDAQLEVLRLRLHERGTENEERIRERLAISRRELGLVGSFDHTIVNDDLEEAQECFRGLVDRITRRNAASPS